MDLRAIFDRCHDLSTRRMALYADHGHHKPWQPEEAALIRDASDAWDAVDAALKQHAPIAKLRPLWMTYRAAQEQSYKSYLANRDGYAGYRQDYAIAKAAESEAYQMMSDAIERWFVGAIGRYPHDAEVGALYVHLK